MNFFINQNLSICDRKDKLKFRLSYVVIEISLIFFIIIIFIGLCNVYFGDIIYCDSIPDINTINSENVNQNQAESLSSYSESYMSGIKCLGLYSKYKNASKVLQGLKESAQKDIKVGIHKFDLAKRTLYWFFRPSKRGGGRGL